MTSLINLGTLNDSLPYSFMESTSTVNTTLEANTTTCVINDDSMSIPLALAYSLMFVFGLLGNVLALYVFLCVHLKKNSVHVFLVNIAVADLILIICLPFRIVYHSTKNQWMLGQTFCKVVGNIFYMNMYISIILLGFISVDRYIKIQCSAQLYKLQKNKWSIITCCITWGMAIAFIIPMISKPEGKEKVTKCFQYKGRQNAKWKAFFNLAMVVVFWIVYISLMLSYGQIAKKLFKLSREKSDLPNARKYRRTAKKSFFVLFIFTVCFVPYHIFRVIYIWSQIHGTTCYWTNIIDKTNEVALLFSTLNSCLDPVMFFLLSGSVRKMTVSLLCRTTTEHQQAKASQATSSTWASFRIIHSFRQKQLITGI
ncbi:probable G-protein coupled receptor 34 [Polyodon spathula]|uniref:probable G-protein coupled receptor 34 n=1 Tax=Polyodon spathula TaxID=7913 RepID=UPI001B7ECDFC|nr:probable G-protein coupled receptor 34 [Polyodon spathula]